jgi:hypothetical protein
MPGQRGFVLCCPIFPTVKKMMKRAFQIPQKAALPATFGIAMSSRILAISLVLTLLGGCSTEGQTAEKPVPPTPAPEVVPTDQVKATGVFATIEVKKHNDAIRILQGTDEQQKNEVVDAILSQPNDFNPPALYALSKVLFARGDKDRAAYWYYLAQIRARYDANLCMDESAKQAAAVLSRNYGAEINKYAFQDMDKLSKTVEEVVGFVRNNKENYDHRWINLHGMWAMTAGLSNKDETRPLSKPESEWESIKKQTIDDYYKGFVEARAAYDRQKKKP